MIGGSAMKRTLFLSSVSNAIILTGFLVGIGIAEAQLVQVSPGYVKAPFVRVYRTPNGTSVQAALNNFDKVASNDQYRQIAQLRSFRATHRLLREYVSLLSLPTADPLPPEPEVFGQRSILVPPTVEKPPEELRLPNLKSP